MNRLSVVAAGALLIVAFVLPSTAVALGSHHADRAVATVPLARSSASPRHGFAPAQFVPLARTLTGTATVLVHAYDFSSNAYENARVDWRVTTSTDQGSGYGFTNASGLATLTGLPAASGNGEIVVYPASGDVMYDLWNLSWPEPAGTDMGVQPGRVSMQLTAGGDWSNYSSAWVDVYGTHGDALQDTGSNVTQNTSGAVTAAEPLTLPGDLSSAAVYFWYDQGAEVPLGGLSASAGGTTPSGLNISQVDCPIMFNFTWASGKPGSAAKVSFRNFPAGWVNYVSGFSASGSSSPVKFYSDWTSPGGTGWTSRTFTVPKTAKPGFDYNIYAEHADGPLVLFEPFQVCTFTPSRTAVSKTGTIRFSGRVPFDPGHTKKLTIYRRTSSAGQPSVKGGFSSPKGWTKIRTCTASGSGKYTTTSFRPGRTSWYVLWYPSDSAANWGAWTSVAKVAVR